MIPSTHTALDANVQTEDIASSMDPGPVDTRSFSTPACALAHVLSAHM